MIDYYKKIESRLSIAEVAILEIKRYLGNNRANDHTKAFLVLTAIEQYDEMTKKIDLALNYQESLYSESRVNHAENSAPASVIK